MLVFLQDLAHDKKKLALASIALVVFLYVDFAFVMGAQMKGLKALKEKIMTTRKNIESLKKDIVYVRNRPQAAASPVSSKKLPTEKEIPSMMQTISAIANENGVRIMQIDAVRPAAKNVKKGASAKPKKGAKPDALQSAAAAAVSQINIKLEMIASYHKLGQFINGLENAEKLCIIEEATINRDAVDNLKQNVSLTVKTYVK